MKNGLITGANKGLGFETARQLLRAGYFVFLGSRNRANGLAAQQQLATEGLTQVAVVEIDVTSDDSVRAAAAAVRAHTPHLDVLLNNAGISGASEQQPSTVALETIRTVWETNFYGVIRTTQAFLPLLHQAPAAAIVNVSSDLASLTRHQQPEWPYYAFKGAAYGPSKTALNAWTVALAYELRDSAIQVNAVNPGFTATDLNGFQGTQTVEQGAAVLVQYATLPADGPRGQFFSPDGPTPW
jgi:NAD(P)-dependent dehydrogenase (short-subunit alcohol dehydrogenase family)